jgi:hypothetical protein
MKYSRAINRVSMELISLRVDADIFSETFVVRPAMTADHY